MSNIQGFKASDILDSAGNVLSSAGDITTSIKRISEQGFPVQIRIEASTLLLLGVGIVIIATLSGALTAYAEGYIKRQFSN